MKHQHARPVLMIALVLVLFSSACARVPSTTAAPTITPTRAATHTPVPTATTTSTPTVTPSPTATPNLAATQAYADFFSLVQKMHDDGVIPGTEGEYIKLSDFSDQFSGNFRYRWKETGVIAKNFIVRSDFDWSVADQKNYSGCGYMFRLDSKGDYYMLAVDAQDGVLMSYTKESTDYFHITAHFNYSMNPVKGNRKLPDMGSNPYHVKFTLVVNELSAYIYLNEKLYSKYDLQKNRLTEAGSLSYMILSGSDRGFGIRCKTTNAEAWKITP